jgi:hypothetical protein
MRPANALSAASLTSQRIRDSYSYPVASDAIAFADSRRPGQGILSLEELAEPPP